MATSLLLIDDDDLSREVLTLLFTEDGYSVSAFASGDATLGWLAAEAEGAVRFDAVLTDLQMPGVHGPALARALRSALGPGTPLIAMSGSTPDAAAIEGFDGFLPKPLTPAALHDLLGSAAATVGRGTGLDREPVLPAESTSPSPVVLEEKTFTELSGMMRHEQMRDLLQLSVSEIDRYARAMHAALREGDAPALRSAAHSLKGSVAMIGARELQSLAGELELGDGLSANQAATLAEIAPATERLRRMLLSRGFELEDPSARAAQEDTIA